MGQKVLELIYAGCDLGVAAAKVAIIDDNGNFAFDIISYKSPTPQAAVDAMAKVLAKAGLSDRKIDRCLSTGLGGKAVPYSDGVVPDAICLQPRGKNCNQRGRAKRHCLQYRQQGGSGRVRYH